ncbi:Protein-serine/threonine phosphatase [Ascochyta rabiei]|nr:Protein-serine/threonine phosphatase [Ascochyta rabiei]UPX20693.1 Protein-serine/threonine phosphatase [Ascochyta rabiei]
MPPKSILKKTHAPAPERNGEPVNQRHLDVALHHANILEQRKAVEAQVLDGILTLMEFPSSPHADAQRPSPADARAFEETVAAFQPADYDALIEERNIAGKCGYALCPKPKARARSTAKKQFVDTDRGVEIVDRKVLEVWCSDDCAKRALYVKVQLNEEPAWLRSAGHGEKMELLVENAHELRATLPVRTKPRAAPAPAKAHDEDDVDAAWAAHDDAAAELARERGEKPGGVTKANDSLVRDTITERASSQAPPQPPSLPAGSTMAIEGHIPRHNRREEAEEAEEAEDEEDDAQDWDKHLPG